METNMKNERNLTVKWTTGNRRLFASCLVLFLLVGFGATAQIPMAVRFANPVFDCTGNTYCLDVEFQSDPSDPVDREIFGKNVRFWYDPSILLFDSFGDYQGGYGPLGTPVVSTGVSGSGIPFGFSDAATYVNGAIQLNDLGQSPIYISKTGWTKLYSVCFTVVDAGSIGIGSFLPQCSMGPGRGPGRRRLPSR